MRTSFITQGPQPLEIEAVEFLIDLEKAMQSVLSKYPYYRLNILLDIYTNLPKNIKDALVTELTTITAQRKTKVIIHDSPIRSI